MNAPVPRLTPLSHMVVRALGYGEATGAAFAVLGFGAPHIGIVVGGGVGLVGAAILHSPRLESPDVAEPTSRARGRLWRWLSAGLAVELVVAAYSFVFLFPAVGFFGAVAEPSPSAFSGPLAVIAAVATALLVRGTLLAGLAGVSLRSPLFALVALAAAYSLATATTSAITFVAG